LKLAYLTEVAALLASHNRLFVEHPDEMSTEAAGDYYILSRNRFNRWMRQLRDVESGATVTDPTLLLAPGHGRQIARTIAEQVLVNEMLTRIWTVMLIARDRFRSQNRIEPLAQNVFLGQLAVRKRALSVCLNDKGLDANDMVAIDKLRESTERWTDLLNCSLMGRYDLWDYAFDESRAQQFLRDREEQRTLDHRNHAWVLILSGLRFSFPDRDGLAASVHEDDRRILRLMLTSFPEDAPQTRFWMLSEIRKSRTP